ncbi:hypothetical protein Tco_0429448 [Tanacetum coccineum]
MWGAKPDNESLLTGWYVSGQHRHKEPKQPMLVVSYQGLPHSEPDTKLIVRLQGTQKVVLGVSRSKSSTLHNLAGRKTCKIDRNSYFIYVVVVLAAEERDKPRTVWISQITDKQSKTASAEHEKQRVQSRSQSPKSALAIHKCAMSHMDLLYQAFGRGSYLGRESKDLYLSLLIRLKELVAA